MRDALDCDEPTVHIVTSEFPGVGKTEWIKSHAFGKELELRTMLISGPVTRDDFVRAVHSEHLTSS